MGGSNDTCLVKPSLQVYDLVSVAFEQSTVIGHLGHVRVILHLLCSAGKLMQTYFSQVAH